MPLPRNLRRRIKSTNLSKYLNLTADLPDLTDYERAAVLEQVSQMDHVEELDLRYNRLRSLPEAIAKMPNLVTLDLSTNQLSTLPESIGELQSLRSLNLARNSFTTLPESFARLQRLTSLTLDQNMLSLVPEVIYQLPSLRILSLKSNKIRDISSKILQLPQLQRLELGGNPIDHPPPELIADGLKAIKQYFAQIEEYGEDYLYEAKLLILGEAGAGKTTLAKKIRNHDYELNPNEDSTQGIAVRQWRFAMKNGGSFYVNLWDFGGQEIYHSTHQFFLSKRSLYVLVADTRKEDTDFYYWLNVIDLLSDNSPVLVVKNEKQDRTREINENQLKSQFTSLELVLGTNLATNRGLDAVVQEIQHHIVRLPHVGAPLPKTWILVRVALEQDARDFITLSDYLDIAKRKGFASEKDALQLSDYLHDLGVILHFQDDPVLHKTVILKTKWGTDAVYRVLDNARVIRNYGRFTLDDLAEIWQDHNYVHMHAELLQLMMNFKLCYKLPYSEEYIAPQLLTENQPMYSWDYTENLVLRYTYEFMPRGIITQFIVAMHSSILENKCVWKSGVVLEVNETRAEVIEYYGKREIRILVAGKYKRDFLTIITHRLDQIHAAYHRLKYDKLIPCNCHVCKDADEPHFYRFVTLQRFMADSQDMIQCQKSYEMVSVRGLIDEVVSSERLKEEVHPEKSPRTITKSTILFMSADPTDYSQLRLGEEQREIREKLQLAKLRNRFKFVQHTSLRPSDISQSILDEKPQIVHFSGHGSEAGGLYFEDKLGNSQYVEPESLAALFDLVSSEVDCVILNACYSEAQARAISKHINHVIGMNREIGDAAAIAFSVGFYQALGAGKSIDAAYNFGCVQIRLQGISDHLTPVLLSK